MGENGGRLIPRSSAHTLKPSLTEPKHTPESPQAAPFVPGGLGGSSSSSSSSLRPAISTGDGLLNTQAAPFKPGSGSAGGGGGGGAGGASSGYYAGGDEGMGYDDGEGGEDGGWAHRMLAVCNWERVGMKTARTRRQNSTLCTPHRPFFRQAPMSRTTTGTTSSTGPAAPPRCPPRPAGRCSGWASPSSSASSSSLRSVLLLLLCLSVGCSLCCAVAVCISQSGPCFSLDRWLIKGRGIATRSERKKWADCHILTLQTPISSYIHT